MRTFWICCSVAGTPIAGVWLIYVSGETIPLVGSRTMMGPRKCGTDMCEKCAELDKKIERCERAVVSVGDRVTVERLMAMVKDLQAQKAALHPQEQK
jgi:hypothetical protein